MICKKCGGDSEICRWQAMYGDGGARCVLRQLENEIKELKSENDKLKGLVDWLKNENKLLLRFHDKVGCAGYPDCYICSMMRSRNE